MGQLCVWSSAIVSHRVPPISQSVGTVDQAVENAISERWIDDPHVSRLRDTGSATSGSSGTFDADKAGVRKGEVPIYPLSVEHFLSNLSYPETVSAKTAAEPSN
jgi:hypothetical protein